MKRIISIVLCIFALAAFALPAMAANTVAEVDAPYGVQYKVNGDGTSERITISCMLTDKLAELTGDPQVLESYGITYAFGYIQLDYRIDGGAWQYTKEWDTAPDSSFYGAALNRGETVKTLDLLYLTNETAMEACGDLAIRTEDGKKLFDLENHSLEFRLRVSYGYTNIDNYVVNSKWTEPIKVERDVKAEKLPTEFEAPIVSDLKVEFLEEDQMPYLTFKIKTPESIKKAQTLYSTQILTGFSLQCFADTGDGYEQVSLNTGSSFYSNETKSIYLSGSEFDDEKRVKVKLKYMIYDADENVLYSQETEPMTVVTPRWEEGKGILHAKCTTCGVCRPIFGVCMFIVFGIAAVVIVVAAVIIKMQVDKAKRRKEEQEAERRRKIEEEKAAYNALKQAKKEKNKKKQ